MHRWRRFGWRPRRLSGYHLGLAGAAVTFLVRSHRLNQLSRPQVLYSYDDHSLKNYTGYDLITDPAMLTGTSFDFVVITLDGASLRAEAGQKVVDEIGRAFRNTSTSVILGSVGIDLRSWFIERSGLADAQVTHGGLGALAYEVQPAKMPLHPGVRSDLLEKADYAYRHLSSYGFSVDLSVPKVARTFAALYDLSGVSQCSIVSVDEYKAPVTMIPLLVAWELLNWPALAEIDPVDETWRLGTEAMREFQRLSIFGPAGLTTSEETDAEGFLEIFRQMEKNALPLDLAAFNSYHHGNKVNSQDYEILHEALNRGEAEGFEMPALHALMAQLPKE